MAPLRMHLLVDLAETAGRAVRKDCSMAAGGDKLGHRRFPSQVVHLLDTVASAGTAGKQRPPAKGLCGILVLMKAVGTAGAAEGLMGAAEFGEGPEMIIVAVRLAGYTQKQGVVDAY